MTLLGISFCLDNVTPSYFSGAAPQNRPPSQAAGLKQREGVQECENCQKTRSKNGPGPRTQERPGAFQAAHKVFPKHLVRQPFCKNQKIQIIAPHGFSEAPGPAVVFGKMEKFQAWLQKASKTLKIDDIDEPQRACHNSQKRRAGGGDPPWGSQYPAGL